VLPAMSVDERCDGVIGEVRAGDGYTLKYRVWTPGNRPVRGVLVLLNGVMSHSLWFHPIAAMLVSRGLKLVGADRRGSGLNIESSGDAPSGKTILEDLGAIIEHERAEDVGLFVVGWCWGAILAINLAAETSGVSGLALLAPGLHPSEEIKQRLLALESEARGQPDDRACLKSPIDEEWFTQGPALTNFIRRDKLRLLQFTPRFYRIMTKLGVGAHLKLPKLDLPTLLVLARRDRATDNEKTTEALSRAARGRADVAFIDSAHGMQFEAPADLARALGDWTERAADTANRGPRSR
jgi:alpha-beta hydrolase superfamily lysophospholipase